MNRRALAAAAAFASVVGGALVIARSSTAREVDLRSASALRVHAASARQLAPRPRRTRWSAQLGARLAAPPAVDGEGNVVVATVQGDVLRLDERDGRERWRASLGARPSAFAPLADGSVAALSASGEVVVVSERHAMRSFALDSARDHAAVVALDEGGFVVTADRSLAVLDSGGLVRAIEALPDVPVAAPARIGGALALATRSGLVLWRQARGPARVVARLPGRPTAVSALSEGRLGAVLDDRRAVVLSMPSGATVLDTEPQPAVLLAPPTADGASTRLLTFASGRVTALSFDGRGHEVARTAVAILPTATAPDGGALALAPRLLSTRAPSGPTALAIEDGSLVVVSEAQGVVAWSDAPCASVTGRAGSAVAALEVARGGALVVACAHGSVVLLEADAPDGAPR